MIPYSMSVVSPKYCVDMQGPRMSMNKSLGAVILAGRQFISRLVLSTWSMEHAMSKLQSVINRLLNMASLFVHMANLCLALQISVVGLQLLLLYDWEHRSRLLFMQQFMVERLGQRPPPLEVPLSYGFAASLVLSQLCLSAAPGALATFYISPANGTVATNATAAVTAMLAVTS